MDTQKPTLLFIGHSFHSKTRSTVFFQDILKREYAVRTFSFDPLTDDPRTQFRPLYGSRFDVVVILQVRPDLEEFHRHVSFGKCVFVPMFDYLPPLEDPEWEPYRNTLVVCFSYTLHQALSSRGFHSRFIRYYPPVPQVPDRGNPRKLFLWQRTTDVSLDTVMRLFGAGRLDEIHHHRALDPGFSERPPALPPPCPVTSSLWFPRKDDLVRAISSAALYMAPRLHEGIGMSFLEAMAMGRCVIAPDNPTMSEYIEHGKTGLLYDAGNPMPLPDFDVRAIQDAALARMKQGREEWERDQESILAWIREWAPPTWRSESAARAPLRSMLDSRTIATYRLFRWIPLLRTAKVGNTIVYWLFGILPLFVRKATQEGTSLWLFGLVRIWKSEVRHG